MRDFPPSVTTFWSPEGERAGSPPDTRSPFRFLLWMLRFQGGLVAVGTAFGVLWQLPLIAGPWVFGRSIDAGIVGDDPSAVAVGAVVLLLLTLVGAAFGIALHTLVVRTWLISLYGTTKMVTRKAAQMGHVLPRRSPTGEILSVASSDSDEFGAMTEIIARAGSQVVSFLAVAAIVMWTSPVMGATVLLAAPVLVGVALPFLRPLHRRQELERNRNSELTSMATDIVAGLRILRGIGGERTFGRNYATQSRSAREAGVSAGIWQAVIEALGVLFSGVFLVLLLWLGTHEVLAGRLTIGELVSFLGYGLYLIGPIRTFFEFAQKITRAMVSARKAIAIFESAPPWSDREEPLRLDPSAALSDGLTGFTARPGQLTVVVSAAPEESARLADRLGRYLPADTEPVSEEPEHGLKGRAARRAQSERARRRAEIAARDAERTRGPWGASLGTVDLADAALADVRRTVLVSDTGSQLFAGTLQDAIDPHRRLTRAQAEEALRTANAEDVYDAMPGGWQGVLDERGRGLSGGQRQRVVLARALAADAPVLVLVEPTSAVDAHTEARIAERVAELRRGRTTIVCTVSPLWLHHADHVVLLADDEVVTEGRHHDLLGGDPAYRAVVARTIEGELQA
ncbi:ABC transporter ATP-binding protein [Luteipulveratus sp. YIM 133132]|uniref:ABC transporter ATP-binding protein n=1 Tax=Luteipulveratus flavus TaxID=3031728 RepID=A0ABT6C1X1_9MICO|nr:MULTISPECIES: ABC transporter ATP-binding protein [unclassified Luteipulveratus]MDE9364793.1 ABC transporter ATP-binding protein [Luteipulveratus sp. YIM 133132]MDF8262650.1 ABC transporter ATP-binding protein [Luteipulveratus sp. YIM 133296]